VRAARTPRAPAPPQVDGTRNGSCMRVPARAPLRALRVSLSSLPPPASSHTVRGDVVTLVCFPSRSLSREAGKGCDCKLLRCESRRKCKDTSGLFWSVMNRIMNAIGALRAGRPRRIFHALITRAKQHVSSSARAYSSEPCPLRVSGKGGSATIVAGSNRAGH